MVHSRWLVCLTVCLFLPGNPQANAATPPNVVLILSDDQAWGDYGFMGHPVIQTPHIDRLAKESLTFTRGYVPDSLCRPSLATIITGRYPHQHGIVGNDPPPEGGHGNAAAKRNPKYLDVRAKYIEHIDDEETLADLLGAQFGYESFQSGKWWEGNYSRGGFTHGMTHGDMTKGGRHGDEGLKIGRQGLDPVFKFIHEAVSEERPFFVWYAPMLPHTPHNPPERLLKKYLDKTPHEPVAKYWAMCEWFDETVGELVGHIDSQGLGQNTIIVYVTDNGWINLPDQSAYADRSKRSQYEGGTRTPIMIRWPGHITPQMDTTHLASSIDIVPTVLAAVEAKAPTGLPGINLLNAEAVSQRKAIFGEILEHDIQHMTDAAASLRFRWIIEGDWKLIVPHAAREPQAMIELFQITEDPHEEKDLSASEPARVQALRAQLDAWWKP